MPPSRGLGSGTGVVRLDRVRERESGVSLPWLSRLEMLPVTRLLLEETDTVEEAGES